MMNVIFINYGLFNSNSGGHIAQFANALASLGVKVIASGSNDPLSVNDFGPPGFEAVQTAPGDELPPARLIEIAGQPDTLIHAWTPRGNVQLMVDAIVRQTGCPYVVHLEDNENLLLASALGLPWNALTALPDGELDQIVPLTLTHPRRGRDFISRSVGATMIVERLSELCPTGVPTHVLEPGVDAEAFCCDLSPEDVRRFRDELYIDTDAKIVVYNGNSHPANHEEIFSLYTAILILRRRGHNIVLIRTGIDYYPSMDVSFQFLKGDWTIDLGLLDRHRMIEVLKLADLYIQPGPSVGFNAYRLPSKIPEFLALGKPLLLPATNLGLRLRDGRDAFLLRRGDAEEIAGRVEEILALPDKGREVGASGRRFAIEHLNWKANASALLQFFEERLRLRESPTAS